MRSRLAEILTETALLNKTFYILSGDHGYALFDSLRKRAPRQFINVGVSEQAMVGIAAGMIKGGLRPLVYGLASFIPIRVLEFIKMDVCYESLPVIFLGDGAGLVYSTLGSSHQCGEDIAVLRVLPNIKIYSPADAVELEYCFNQAYADTSGASYIRIGKSDKPPVHQTETPLSISDGCIKVASGNSSVLVLATGSMVSTAKELAPELGLTVYSIPGLSDFSEAAFQDLSRKHETIVTLEEHSLIGGLGSIVDQYLVSLRLKKTVIHFGLQKQFTSIASSYESALTEHGLALTQIRGRLLELL